LGGSKTDKLKNTLIKNCVISNVENNDCITIHKDKNHDDVGSVHHIESNILSGCAEQGIDITSGSDITLLNNTTYGNGDSGILIGHRASNILIKNHLSVDDGRYAGILVHKSNAVSLIDNCILNSNKHQLVFKDAKNILFRGNVVYQGKSKRGSVIDIAKNTKGVRFIDNRIVSESISGSLLLRYLNKNDPVKSVATFISNIWRATNDGKSSRFYTVD
jgi:parallel beta-helix repeat protein